LVISQIILELPGETLDSQAGIEYHTLWPAFSNPSAVGLADAQVEKQVRDCETDKTVSPEELRERYLSILNYLRLRHNYCVFCAHKYAHQEELALECPGGEDEH